MKTSVEKLKIQPDIILVDGNKSFNYNAEVIPIVKGDSKSLSIASASIIAKVIRDRIMMRLAKKYPNYAWNTNKGYPTAGAYSGSFKVWCLFNSQKNIFK